MKYLVFIISIFFCHLGFSNTKQIIYDSLNYPLQYCHHYILSSIKNYQEGVTSGFIIPQQEFLGSKYYLRRTPYSSSYNVGIFEIVSTEKNNCKKNIHQDETFYIIFKNINITKPQYLSRETLLLIIIFYHSN
jgi:hypothetical protein